MHPNNSYRSQENQFKCTTYITSPALPQKTPAVECSVQMEISLQDMAYGNTMGTPPLQQYITLLSWEKGCITRRFLYWRERLSWMTNKMLGLVFSHLSQWESGQTCLWAKLQHQCVCFISWRAKCFQGPSFAGTRSFQQWRESLLLFVTGKINKIRICCHCYSKAGGQQCPSWGATHPWQNSLCCS